MLPRTLRRFLKALDSSRSLSTISPPPRRRSSDRKPLVTPITELKRRARLQRKSRHEVRELLLHPPDNGLLVKSLVPVAYQVFAARAELLDCASKVSDVVSVHVCRVCGEVHVGTSPHQIRTCDVARSMSTKEHSWVRGGVEHLLPLVESFHLYDRLGRAVSHNERLQVDRIPAIVELCIQAGVDVPEYPTKRRVIPVYNIAGKMIDFEKKFRRDFSSGKDIQPFGFWERKKSLKGSDHQLVSSDFTIRDIAVRGMEAWENMHSGAVKLMQKYSVQTCGFCPEVQVGPKGHWARICRAYKHQMRDGQHAWQEATIDDIVPPVYVWHTADLKCDSPLVNELRRYYVKLPAAMELFTQAGASIGEGYGMMVVPTLEEEKLAV